MPGTPQTDTEPHELAQSGSLGWVQFGIGATLIAVALLRVYRSGGETTEIDWGLGVLGLSNLAGAFYAKSEGSVWRFAELGLGVAALAVLLFEAFG